MKNRPKKMDKYKRHCILWIATLGMAMATAVFAVNIPRLNATYYGQILTPFGYPATAGDAITLFVKSVNDAEVSQFDLGPVIGPDINYRLLIDVVDSGSGVDGTSVADGSAVIVEALWGSGAVSLIGDTNITVESGSVTRRDFLMGTDTNDNGIPDEWEQFVINALATLGMNVGITNLADFDVLADYDGDGVNNRDEFFSGSLPFLEGDFLRIEEFHADGNGVNRIRFLGNAGFSYQVYASGDPLTGSWQVSPISSDPVTPGNASIVTGRGDMQDVYFPTNGLAEFFRLMVK
jgi:hypothetical protein